MAHTHSQTNPAILKLLIILAVPMMVIAVSIIGIVTGGSAIQPAIVDAAAIQNQLRGEVDTTTGAPRSGRDPASQSQNSLATVASQPTGIGMRTDTIPAAMPNNHQHVQPAQVIRDPKQSSTFSNGCLSGYGLPGEQCVPASLPANQADVCTFIKKIFPKGVKITGTDTRHLNTGNNTACGTTAG